MRRLETVERQPGGVLGALARFQEKYAKESIERARRNKASLVYRRKDGEEIVFRSMWERDFAAYMDAIGYDWVYEPTSCMVDDSKYTPDFFVFNDKRSCFVELHAMRSFPERYGDSAEKRINACFAVERQLGAPLYILDEDAIDLVRKLLREANREQARTRRAST